MPTLRHSLFEQIKQIPRECHRSPYAEQRALSHTLAIYLQLIEIVIPSASLLLQEQRDSPAQAAATTIDGHDPPNAGR